MYPVREAAEHALRGLRNLQALRAAEERRQKFASRLKEAPKYAAALKIELNHLLVAANRSGLQVTRKQK